MSSRPVSKLCLSSALCSTALFLAACSHGGSGDSFSLAGNPPNIDQPSANDQAPIQQQPGDDVILGPDAGGGGGGGSGGGGGGGGGGGTPRTRVVVGEDGTLSRVVAGVDNLISTGNADLGGLLDPLKPTVGQVDSLLNPVAGVVVANQPLVGSAAAGAQQLVGVSALSNGQPTGQLVAVGLLNNPATLASLSLGGQPALVIPLAASGGGAGGATSPLSGVLPTDLAALNVAGTPVLGSSTATTPALAGVGLGAPTTVPGQLASANVGADGNIGVTVGSGLGAAAPAGGGLVIPIPGVVTVGVLNGGSVASVNSPLLTTLTGALTAPAPAPTPAPASGGVSAGLLAGLGLNLGR